MAEAIAEKKLASVARRSVSQPPLSLTKAAKAVGVSTSTLRRAIDDGKLKATRTDEGHYRIPIDQLMQYKSNELDTPVDTGVATDATGVSTQAASSMSQGDVAPPAAAPVDAVSLKRVHEAEKEALRVEIKHQRDTISRLESDVETWKQQADKWQAQTENYKFLLTDERDASEKLKDEMKTREEERLAAERERFQREQETVQLGVESPTSRTPWLVAAVAALALVGAGLAVLYPDQARELLAGQGSATPEAAALTAESSPAPDTTPR